MKNSNRIFLQGITKLEAKYQPKFLRIIKAFRNRFISDLQTNGADYAKNRLQLSQINPDLSELIKSLYGEAGLFGARLTASELKSLLTQKDISFLIRTKAGFGKNTFWIRAVQEFLRLHLLRLVNRITETMRQDILNILDKSFEEGLSINEQVRELKRLDLMEARSRVIARTETVRAANVGHSVGAKENPYEVNKKWSAAKDHRTRHSHRDINGHVVDEDETFKVPIYKGETLIGHDNMLYPGDATAHPSNTVNCRCRAVYTGKRDANGNLILREQTTAQVVPMSPVRELTPAQIAAQLKKSIEFVVE